MSAPIRTIINNENQITFCNSPIYARITNDALDNTILSVRLKLWIWNGSLNKILGSPNYTFVENKISAEDTYILFEFSQEIKSFLVTPPNALNTNQPQFLYNELTNPTITGQGVFWQIQAEVTSASGTVVKDFNTNFATLGYRWNYEQTINGNNGIAPNQGQGFDYPVTRWYDLKIHNYITQSFNLTNSLSVATTANMITQTEVVPQIQLTKECQSGYAIVFLNKLGLFEFFTPTGKVVTAVKLKNESVNRSYRDALNVNNNYQHGKVSEISESIQSYTINTGLLKQEMTELVEQIIMSPKIYLIKFKGDLQPNTTVGITIDNTAVTIDDTNITIDSKTITDELIGFYKTHQQIPVICTDSDFQYRNIYNDKTNIQYTIKLEETRNKIL